jgi:ZIP family zinc transporter
MLVESFALGAVAQLSLVLSGLAVYRIKVRTSVSGNLAAFGAGGLIAAVSTDLIPGTEALRVFQVALWMLIGAGTFIVGDHFVEKKFGGEGAGGALGIVVGSVVDGVPESIIFGIQIARGAPISVAFITAVFVSNIPQALAPSADLAESGWKWMRVSTLWLRVVLACGAASTLGYIAATALDRVDGSRMAAFAAGGILAMLTGSLIPFAHERSERAGLWTVVGFCSALAMT